MTVLNSPTIGKVIDQIIATGHVTRRDQKLLQNLSRVQPWISNEEYQKIQRLRQRLQMGLLKLV